LARRPSPHTTQKIGPRRRSRARVCAPTARPGSGSSFPAPGHTLRRHPQSPSPHGQRPPSASVPCQYVAHAFSFRNRRAQGGQRPGAYGRRRAPPRDSACASCSCVLFPRPAPPRHQRQRPTTPRGARVVPTAQAAPVPAPGGGANSHAHFEPAGALSCPALPARGEYRPGRCRRSRGQ
jgi:hypothetical protein